jgi:hypothetical protein
MRVIALLALTLLAVGGGCAKAETVTALVAPSNEAAPKPLDADALQALVVEAIHREACPKLRGQIVGLPDDGGASTSGRWLLRDCETHVDGTTLSMHVAGHGWQYVDRESHGFRVRQYVYFSASFDARAHAQLAYHADRNVAMVRLVPDDALAVKVNALGTVSADAQNWGAMLVGVVGRAVAHSPDSMARAQIATEGEAILRAKLAEGATLAYDSRAGTFAFTLGASEGGAPRAPEGVLVDERERLHGGGVLVSGPFDASSPVELSVSSNEGESKIAYRAICERDAELALDALFRREHSSVNAPGSRVAASSAPIVLTPPACRWVLVTASADGTDTTARVVLRRGAAASSPPEASTSTRRWARVTLLKFALHRERPDGTPWDPYDGQPDPHFWVVTPAGDVSLGGKLNDTAEASPFLVSPIFEVERGAELSVRVDEELDDSGPKPIGVARFVLDARPGPRDLDLPVLLEGIATGAVTVRVEEVPAP